MNLDQLKDNFDYLFRVILVGDSGVGKTNLLLRFTKNEFDINTNSTIGVDFATKTVKIGSQMIKAQIWDTAGQDRFKSISTAFYRGASAVLIVFDITNRNSFKNIEKWYDDAKRLADVHAVMMLVGNKKDKSRQRIISLVEATEYAKLNNMSYIETSAFDASNVEEAFINLLNEVYIVHSKFKKEFTTDSEKFKNGTSNSKLHIFQQSEDSSSKKYKCC